MCSPALCVFLFKQKTAYEMRISDWSSDVCSSDLRAELGPEAKAADALIENVRILQRLPGLVKRIEEAFPEKGGAPPPPPLTEVRLIRVGSGWGDRKSGEEGKRV